MTTPTPDKRPDVEGIMARAQRTFDAAGRDGVEIYSRPEFMVTTILLDIPALIAYIKALEAVVEAARLVGEGTAVEIGSTPLRMRNLRNKLAALDGEGDG